MAGAIVPIVPSVPGDRVVPPALPWPDDDAAWVDPEWDEGCGGLIAPSIDREQWDQCI